MAMKSFYIKENERYSSKELRDFLCYKKEFYSSQNEADSKFKSFVKDLKSRGILKSHKDKDDSVDYMDDVVFDDSTDEKMVSNVDSFSFQFVGIIIIQERILYCYPKYLNKNTPDLEKQMYQVFKVLEKYSRQFSKQDVRNVNFFSDIDEAGKINLLSVILFILEDYAENGLYQQEEKIIEINGNGEILWQKSVDTFDPIFQNGTPIYTELYTKKGINNELDFFRLLHAYVVTKCSEEVEKTSLASFFGLPTAEISEDDEEAFGDVEYIVERLEKELTVVFDDRRVLVLKAMLAYFAGGKIITGDNNIQLIGTRTFHRVWETACAEVYKTQKTQKVNTIAPKIKYDKNRFGVDPTLVELIKKPIWKRYADDKSVEAKKTFDPDYLRFEHNNDEGKEEYTFYIIDAKYYCPRWGKNTIDNQPGVEDIAKQYMYYLAYIDVLKEHPEITSVKNYFIMPQVDNSDNNDGYAKLEILETLKVMENHNLGVIEVRCLSPQKLFDDFLQNKTRNLIELSEINEGL